MRRFRVSGMVAAAALMGSTALVGLGAAPAGATYRGAAGVYLQHLFTPGHGSFNDVLTMYPNHTFTINDGGPTGTWSQPGLGGTVVLDGTIGPTHYRLTAAKESNGLGSVANPGTVLMNGHLLGFWWARIAP